MQARPPTRLSAALGASGAVLSAAIAYPGASGLLAPGWPVALSCVLLALTYALCATVPAPFRRGFGPIVAALRLTTVLLLVCLWQGEARDLWSAVAVWIGFRDADEGLVGQRPVLPAAIALAVALTWSAYRPGPAGMRALLVGIVAGAAAARASQSYAGRALGTAE